VYYSYIERVGKPHPRNGLTHKNLLFPAMFEMCKRIGEHLGIAEKGPSFTPDPGAEMHETASMSGRSIDDYFSMRKPPMAIVDEGNENGSKISLGTDTGAKISGTESR
jgi:hypothetical protein